MKHVASRVRFMCMLKALLFECNFSFLAAVYKMFYLLMYLMYCSSIVCNQGKGRVVSVLSNSFKILYCLIFCTTERFQFATFCLVS